MLLAVLAWVVLPVYAGPAQTTASLETYDRDKINEATPGLREVRLGTRLQGPLTVGLTSETVGDDSDADNYTAGESITTAAVDITTGAMWGSSTTLEDGYVNQEITFTLVTDGGQDHKITPETKTGFTDVTLSNAGDSVTLKYIDDTTGWRIKSRRFRDQENIGVTSVTYQGDSTDNPSTSSTIDTAGVDVVTNYRGGLSRLLADGYINQEITFVLSTDAGFDFTVTPDTKKGFTSVTLSDEKDSCTLRYIDDITGWMVAGSNAATVN